MATQIIAPRHPGDLVQNFTLPDQDGNPRSLSDFAATPVVLFFYPRADTPGCTIESCGFRDAFEQFQTAGVTVLGISRDTVKSQKKFQEKYHLPYPLLADADEIVCNAFDLIQPKNMYGKLVKGVARTTFLIAPANAAGEQRLLHTFEKVKPEGHAEEVLGLLAQSKESS
jgi:peroxiredoxin Q/BCP